MVCVVYCLFTVCFPLVYYCLLAAELCLRIVSIAMLSVTVKTVKQQTVKIEVGQTATALDLKGQIQETLGAEFPAENQKLIFKGKILQDTAIIGEIGLTDTSFVVVMVSKPKPAPVPVTPPASAPPVPSEPPQAPAPSSPPLPEGATGETQTHEQMVDNLMEMTGNTMPRVHVTGVLTRCQNNPIIAGDMLSGGMEDLGGAPELPGPQGAGIGAGVPSGGGVNPLEFLRSQPQFQQLRTVLQANPQALAAVLSQMQQSNPALFELINNNQSEFMQLMNDPAIDPVGPTGGQEGQAGQALPPGAISVTPTEMEAINRLKALGFSEQMAVQAYFACEKNEEMAANFLLSDDTI